MADKMTDLVKNLLDGMHAISHVETIVGEPMKAGQATVTSTLALGVLYGGLAEEVMMRWGLMSAVLFALTRVAGRVYGWLFWRRGLEASMASHASTHLGFALARIAL